MTKKASMACGADRISALPDELLHHVMSFLPAHDVVSTSLLAQRWHDLWKSAPALRVTGVKGCTNPAWFIQFVDNLLLLRHPGARLDSFVIDLEEQDFCFEPFLPAYERSVNLWFRHALLSQVRILSLRTTNAPYVYWEESPPFELPDVPIISKHLTRLHLARVTLRSSTLDFSGCPALVELKMESNGELYDDISAPFLKHLSIVRCDFPMLYRARVSAPCLVSLVVSDCGGRTPLLESMPALVSAVVRLTGYSHDMCSKNSYGDCGRNYGDIDPRNCFGCYYSGEDRRGESVLLRGLSQVSELEISVGSNVFIINRDLELFCPMFGKLKTLLLSEFCPGVAVDRNILTCFLSHSPILENLTFQVSKVPKARVKTERSYLPLEQPFVCRHLKVVEIKCKRVDRRIQQLLDILSPYGIPLEQINIQRTNRASGPSCTFKSSTTE